VLNIVDKKLSRVVGKNESTERFMQVALYQGKAVKPAQPTSTGNVHAKSSTEAKPDPMFVCTAFKKNRFYVFTRREPVDAFPLETAAAAEAGQEGQ